MKKILLLAAALCLGTAEAQTCQSTDPGATAGATSCVTLTYNGTTAEYTTVRGADGNIWLQQNLGSAQVATSSTDAAAFGDYFQWGRWQDGHEKNTSVMGNAVTPNNPSGVGTGNTNYIPTWWSTGNTSDTWQAATPAQVSATDGCDPCKAALGGGWRLPTEAEWTAAIAAENITNIEAGYTSNLKLAVAGYRGASGSFTFVGQRGYYWNSNASATLANYGRNLYYSNAIVNPNAGAPRGQGHTIRCIKGQAATPPPVPASLAISVQGNAPAAIATNDGTLQLLASVTPSTASQSVAWSITSGSEFASVSGNGLVTAIANGSVTIQAASTEVPTVLNTIMVTITNQVVLPTSVEITSENNVSAINTNAGTLQLTAAVLPAEADQSVTWSVTSGNELATLSTAGLVTAIANGTVTVQAVSTVNAALIDTIDIIITNQVVLPTSVEITSENNVSAINTNAGTLQLTAAVLPAGADQSVTWSITSGNELATLSTAGLVSAIANGTVTIQAVSTADATLIDTIDITITNQYVAPISLGLTIENDNSPSIISEGGTLQLVAAILPADANQDVTWSITSGSEFATIDINGLVTATADGVVTIQAVSNDDATILDTVSITIINQDLASAAPYCDAVTDYDVEPISLVQFAGINNATSADVNTTPAYENFTTISGNVVKGGTYALTVEGNTVGLFSHDVRVFIDWNQDNAFDMASEYYATAIENTTGTDGVQATLTITVPETASVGTTRLRITKDQWNVYEEGEFDACTNAYYGQVEDYSLNVTNPVAGLDDVNKTTFTVYPNPTQDIVTIQANAEVKSIAVYNLTGQLIATTNTAQLSLGNASAGIYIMKISFADGSAVTQKIVKRN
jgi:uncharacterized protein YjdB